MRDFVQQTKTALEVYVERGKQALRVLDQEKYEDFFECLNWRKAAYHNFMVADVSARKSGYDIAQDTNMKRVVDEMRYINAELEKTAKEHRKLLEEQLGKTRKTRMVLGGYKNDKRSNRPTVSQGI